MTLTLRVPEVFTGLTDAIGDRNEGRIDAGLVFVASGPALASGWEPVAIELGEAFEMTQRAASDAAPVVYVVSSEDLLGQNSTERAMVACGLLSGARTAAFEGAKAQHTANVLAVEEETPLDDIADWILRLLESKGTSGELTRIGSGHLGKALP